MIARLAALAALSLAVATTTSGCGARWVKGNIHTHSLWSDGNDFPENIAAWYGDRGYDFLAISDHNILSRGSKWMRLSEIDRRSGGAAIAKCRERFGPDAVEIRGEGELAEARLRNLDEIRALLEVPGEFLLIEGEEITDAFGKLPVHLNATNLGALIQPQGGTSVEDVIRRNVAAVRKQADELDRNILIHLNHPNFGWAVTAEDLAAVTEERYYEVYNGHPGVHHTGDEYRVSVERMWDIANAIRIAKLGAPPLFGIATDDSHEYHGTKGSIPGRGWICVRALSLDADSIIAAMERGEFYASSGVELSDVEYDAERREVSIEVSPVAGVNYTTRFIGTRRTVNLDGEPVIDRDGKPVVPATRRYRPEVGEVLALVTGTRAVYRLTGEELYVRAVVESSRPPERPVYEGQREEAWTQPFGWEVWLDRSQEK
jgi:hypothetical protein